MKFYLGTPGNQLAAHHAAGFPWLVSFATYKKIRLDARYFKTANSLLIDSGAYSVLKSGVKVDLSAYRDWALRCNWADAIAGLDDIEGDWRASLKNYEAFPESFPTIHDTDPKELLPELCALAAQRDGWLGIGLLPPRQGKEPFVREAIAQARDLGVRHIHGWALKRYAHLPLDSIDSNNWSMDQMKILSHANTKHLTSSEALEVVLKRYLRDPRLMPEE